MIKEETGTFFQEVYSVSLRDMIDVWVETFNPFGTVLVICDAGQHFNLLKECGVLCSPINSYDNKFLTVSLLGVDDALKVIDNMHSHGYHPVVYVYDNAKMILDNIEP
tara:strand:- start:2497 stop:2820 length:324 start_codon:yes stop_codon:yes gene_type:complete